MTITEPNSKDGKPVEVDVALAIGHGLLHGGCGSCALTHWNNKYALVFQVDVRACSLEFSGSAQEYLEAGMGAGGGCKVPDVLAVDCNDIMQGKPIQLKDGNVINMPNDNQKPES